MTRIVPTNAVLVPQGAKRVFKGQIYDVYQWPQKLFDGSVATFEMLKRVDTIQVLALTDDRIIALEEVQPGRPLFLKLPGGRAEEGEDWLAAAKRECQEELGMEFASWRLITVRQPIVKIEWFVATFVAFGLVSERPPQPDAGERMTIMQLSLEDWKRRLDAEANPFTADLRQLFASIYSVEQLKGMPSYQGRVVD
jgi:ADP-ribose diphosphatase